MGAAHTTESCELARQVAHDVETRLVPAVDRLDETTGRLVVEVALLRAAREAPPPPPLLLCAQSGEPRCALAGKVQDVARSARTAKRVAVWTLDKALPLAAVIIALLALLSRSPAPAQPEPPPAASAPATIPITAAGPPAVPGREP